MANDLKLGTARINPSSTPDGRKYFIVRWMNHGNFLQNDPRGFFTKDEAVAFCREYGLDVLEA